MERNSNWRRSEGSGWLMEEGWWWMEGVAG